jgi:hypothetical protein
MDRRHFRTLSTQKGGILNNKHNFPFGNVLPIRKSDKFGVYLGEVTSSGEVIEGESVGTAFLKHGSKNFRLKLFMHSANQYFVVPDDKDNAKYLILSLEEYQLPNGETKSTWHKIGDGKFVGNFIALRLQLLSENLFLCLFPEKLVSQEDSIAS